MTTGLQRLQDRHALLTGAGGGIGLAVAEAFLAEGARCTVLDLEAAPSAGVAALLAAHADRLAYVGADIAKVESLGAVVDAAAQRYGTVDVLFNNAAIFDMAPLLESDERMYQRLFDVNVKGMFFMMQAVLARLVATGRTGSVVNMASQAMAPHGIRVNAIAPGVIDTPMWGHVDALFARYEGLQPGEKKIAVGKAVPLGRMGAPDDVAGAAVFLASAESAYITAQTLNVDGGNVMS
jgi:D-sorbitol dehydrogenase (acceptor)